MDGVYLQQQTDWEALWAPYDETTYQQVLDLISGHDTVLDIGAGDMRLAVRMAQIAAKVIALEIRRDLIQIGRKLSKKAWPQNLIVISGDARLLAFPGDVTTGVLLMRHCRHFQLYAEKLKAAGARRLITNARWGMSVEIVDLQRERIDFDQFDMGWYACWCGVTGFKPGPVQKLNDGNIDKIWEIHTCPSCGIIG